MLGSFLNRFLVERYELPTLIGIGAVLLGLAAASLATIAVLDRAPVSWYWGSLCAYLLAVGVLMPNATVVALEPLPKVAGVASSIIGSIQNLTGAAGATIGAAIYDGSVRNASVTIAIAGTVTFVIWLLRPLISPKPIGEHHSERLGDRR